MAKSRGRKKQKSKRKIKRVQPWKPIKMRMVERNDPFPKEMTQDEKRALIINIGKRAQEDFEKNYELLNKWFSKYDSIYLLSFCAFYFLAGEEGVDREAVYGRLDFYPHYLEILQCMSLFQSRVYTAKPLAEEIEDFKSNIERLGQSLGLRYYNLINESVSEKEMHAYNVRLEMMINTLAIRNWAYDYQMLQIGLDLSSSIRKEFIKVHGFDPKDIFDLFFEIVGAVNNKLNAHIDNLRKISKGNNYIEILELYEDCFPGIRKIDQEAKEIFWESVGKKKENLISVLMSHADLSLSSIFTFNHNELDNLLNRKVNWYDIFDKISFEFRDLESYNKEYIFLNNPVHLRPFIKVGNDEYFSAIAGLLPHLSLGVFEHLISENDDLKILYSEIRATYLEDKLHELFEKSFPSGRVFKGSQYLCSETGKIFENDLIVLIEDFAIIIEAKSGIITSPAKRGAPNRLFETLKELVEEPSVQAIRFMKYLKENRKIHEFKSKKEGVNVIDSTTIKYFIPLGVTFSNLGFIGSNLKKLIEAEIITNSIENLAPSISLTDLEVIFELLPYEAQKIHYLARRREFEAHAFYQGDELDLLAFYLDTGFNIGDDEYEQKLFLDFSIKSKELDPYMRGSRLGKNVSKPQIAMTKWWNDLLYFIATRKGQQWLQSSFILLNASQDDQVNFEKATKKMKGLILSKKMKQPNNWVLFLCGPPRRRYAIVWYPYQSISKEERNKVLNQIIGREKTELVRGLLIIGQNIDKSDYPYSVLAGSLDTSLFDSLTINDVS